MARRRVKVGTLIGTEDRNDDDLIARTPPMKFGPGPVSSPAPTETTTPPSRVDASPALPTGDGGREGDGSGGNGPSGNSQPGGRDTSLAGLAESAISAMSNVDPSAAPAGLAKGIGIAADVLGSIPSDMFGELGEKAGVGMQNKSQAAGTVAQAMSMIGKQDPEKQDKKGSEDYAPPDPTMTPQDKAYNPQDYQDLNTQADTSGDTNAPGNDTMGTSDHANAGGETQGGSGTDSGVGDGSGPDGTGDGSGPGGGGSGAPGGSSDAGPGSWKDGVIDIQGPDPTQEGEAIPGNTLHEGETVLTEAETTLIGEKALKKVRQIAADKNTRLSQRSRAAKSTLLSAARG